MASTSELPLDKLVDAVGLLREYLRRLETALQDRVEAECRPDDVVEGRNYVMTAFERWNASTIEGQKEALFRRIKKLKLVDEMLQLSGSGAACFIRDHPEAMLAFDDVLRAEPRLTKRIDSISTGQVVHPVSGARPKRSKD